jgi:hypothetical protein
MVRSLALLALLAVAACHAEASVNAKTSGDLTGSSTAPPPAATPEQPAPAPPADPMIDTQCPFKCAVARPSTRQLTVDDVSKLKIAFASTMQALRQCASQDPYARKHGPTLNLRFAGTGDLVDVGVDGHEFYGDEEMCMTNVVRGGAANPDVKIPGPADVRCSERCDRNMYWIAPNR